MKKINQIKILCGKKLMELDLNKSSKLTLLNIIEKEKDIKILNKIKEQLDYLNRISLYKRFIPINIYKVLKLDFSKCNKNCIHLNSSLEVRLCVYQCKLEKKVAEYNLIKNNYKGICKGAKNPIECNQRGLLKVYKLQKQILDIQDVIKYTEQKIKNSEETNIDDANLYS
jgi:hypothetical protein